jgi:YkoY family integral membrane protein
LSFIVEFLESQKFQSQDLAVVLLLTVLEGLLSIDNALVLGLLAKRLPKHLQHKALNWGIILAVVFRFAAIFMASLLLRWTIVKLLGGGYLVYIAVRHLFFESKEEEKEKIVLDAKGHPIIVDEDTGGPLRPDQAELEIRERVPVYIKPERMPTKIDNFWPTVISIGLTDIAFAVDSILAAIALVGSAPPGGYHPKLWVVLLGGLLGIMLLRVAAGVFIWLLGKFPRFEVSAYLLVMVIGCKLLADWGLNSDWTNTAPSFERTRQAWTESYEKWLEDKWVFKIQPHGHHAQPPAEPVVAEPAGADHSAEPVAPALKTPRHLLDFHDLRRPECMGFWLSMLVCFLSGFIPPRKEHHKPA